MNFKDFINSRTDEELEDYATRSGTTSQYIKCHLLNAYKEPRKKLRAALADESNGLVSHEEILKHFYKQEVVTKPISNPPTPELCQ